MNAIDKILIAHRNTKLCLLMMTGPFLVGMKLLSWSLKAFVLLFLYKAGLKGGDTDKKAVAK
jgi:hypothetical protein